MTLSKVVRTQESIGCPTDLSTPPAGSKRAARMADRKYRLLATYEKRVWFLLGICSRLLPGRTVEGWQAVLKEYTDCWVCVHEELLVQCETERIHVKSLPGNGAPWVARRRSKDDGIFKKDDVIELAGIGEETVRKLKSFGSIKKVMDLAIKYEQRRP